ncbi:MAG TPA: hypothetical protein VGO67_01000 [Verrucomicrobiae bacterium]|jgi:hypothetical protein
MHLNAPEISQQVFHFLDGIIRDYGDILFLLFAYAAIPFLVWVMCGGLRRTLLTGKRGTNVANVSVIYLPLGLSRPPPEPLPPLIGENYEPHCCEFDGD